MCVVISLLMKVRNYALYCGRLMRPNNIPDLIINIILPLACGVFVYLFKNAIVVESWIRNYLPDGLWSYAFTSAILIIWKRSFNLLWLLLVLMSGIYFEWMQYKDIIPGTADLTDVCVYLLSFFFAIIFNPVFKQTFKYQNS